GYCAKETPVDQIAGAIDTVMRGEIWLDPTIAEMVVRDSRTKKGGDRVKLSETETRILSLMSKGSSNEEIALSLNTTTGIIARRMHD
ncbi:hypothetical protein ABTK01_20490, partial [Acinetobacter baumannii]